MTVTKASNAGSQIQIPWGRIRNHTAGRIDAITKIAISAIFTVVATLKFLGRGTVFLAKKICGLGTDETRGNLVDDLKVISVNALLIVKSVAEVIIAPKEAPKEDNLCSVELLRWNLSVLFLGNNLNDTPPSVKHFPIPGLRCVSGRS